MSDVIKKGGKPMPSNKGLTMDEFTEYRRIIHEAVKMFQNLPVDEQRSILSYSRIDDTIGKPVLYSDGEISREIEEYTDDGGDLDKAWALIIENCPNVDMLHTVLGGYFGDIRATLSQQAAEIEQKDKRIAELGKELKQAKDMMDKWCDFAMLTEHAQDKYHPTLRDETMHFLYPKQALSNTGEK